MSLKTIEYPSFKSPSTEYQEIWLAGGCFWGTEEFLSRIDGVITTSVGYANGSKASPTYEEVCSGTSNFAEAVYVQYSPKILSLPFLLTLYYKTVNPFTQNQQGADIGSQYRTGVYYIPTENQAVVSESLEKLSSKLGKPVVIENKVLENFYLAEEYHQKYLQKNPAGYCHISKELFSTADKAKEFAAKSDEELKQILSPEQYHITQENGTEPAFKNPYHDEFRKGIYVSVTTGEPLFASSDKFDAGCGWPAFSRPLSGETLAELPDTTRGRVRTEVRSTLGDDHLGHVFEDGPAEQGGLRYCINSAALVFVPIEEMKEKGFEKYLPLVK